MHRFGFALSFESICISGRDWSDILWEWVGLGKFGCDLSKVSTLADAIPQEGLWEYTSVVKFVMVLWDWPNFPRFFEREEDGQ